MRTIPALAVASVFFCLGAIADLDSKGTVAGLAWKDLSGKEYGATDIARAKATVFLFVSTECPIANAYTPRILELAKSYKSRGAAFFLVDSSAQDSEQALAKYAKERAFPFPAIRDSGAKLADKLEANTTPEAFVLDAAGVIRYRGRIDDNRDRERVVRKDLAEALDAVLAGEAVARPRTLAFGCSIFREKSAAKTAPAKVAVSYTKDVATILNRNCVVCHREGEVAPFSLERYELAKVWANSIRDYTERRLMPPWKPVDGVGDFHDRRSLTQQEIGTLARWADSGAPRGNPADLPPAPKFEAVSAWALGKPDVVLTPGREYHLDAEGRDVYRNFVMPINFDKDTYIAGLEFQPGNRAIVHHVVTYIDPAAASVVLDGKDKEPGYSIPGAIGIGVLNAQWGEVWVPGNAPHLMPAGTAKRIPKGAKLVMQVHYHKSGKPETDLTKMAIYYAKGPVERTYHMEQVGNMFFELKPGSDKEEVVAHNVIPGDVKLHSIFPHMHMIGKDMKVTATLPDGHQIPLIYIDDWDFNWQATYFYKQPISLPKGTRIDLIAHFDNSSRNPRQTNNPPKMVTFGEQTTDEMCFAFLGVTYDRERLAERAAAK